MMRFYGLTARQVVLAAAVSVVAATVGCQSPVSGSPAGSGTVATNMAASAQAMLKTPEQPMSRPIAEGTNALFRHSVSVNAPPDRIWAIWMDVANWPTWDTELTQAAADAPLALGIAGKVTTKNGTVSSFKIVSFQPQLPTPMYAFETPLPSATLKVTRSLVRQGASTVFTHEVAFAGDKGAVFADQFGPGFRAALPRVMDNIAAQALRTN